MYCLIVHLVENASLLDMTEIINIAVSFHCDTCNTFLAHSCCYKCQNGIENSRKGPEQSMVGCFAEFKINSKILHF